MPNIQTSFSVAKEWLKKIREITFLEKSSKNLMLKSKNGEKIYKLLSQGKKVRRKRKINGFGVLNRISDIRGFWRSTNNCSEKLWKRRKLCGLISRWAPSWRLDLGISAEATTRRCSRSTAVFRVLSVKSTNWFKVKRKPKQIKRRRRVNLRLTLLRISNL